MGTLPFLLRHVVEYVPGGTLKQYLIRNRRKQLALKIVIQLALDLSRGFSYLYSKKIVYRDVKTENMLLDSLRTLKIADFGVALVEAQNPKDMTGETGILVYMATEVLQGKPYNRRCDVYSFMLMGIYCCDMPYPDLSFADMSATVVSLQYDDLRKYLLSHGVWFVVTGHHLERGTEPASDAGL